MLLPALTVLLALTVGAPSGAVGQTRDQARECGRDAFSKAVDDAAGGLRKHSSETQPRILAGIRQLKARHAWRDEDESERARELLSDAETEALDQKAAQLLAALDRLSEEGSQNPAGDCTKLSELRATAAALHTTVRTKTEIVLKRLDSALAGKPGEKAPSPSVATPKTPPLNPMPRISSAQPMETAQPAAPATPTEVARAPIPPLAVPPEGTPAAPPALPPAPVGQWTVTTTPLPAGSMPPSIPPQDRVASLATPAPATPPKGSSTAGDTYTIDEIRTAARGVFGSISTNLASVIEYAFSNYGRPTAYVLGEEGGGAFIAGVRYGSGRLYAKRLPSTKVYWHGPSVGYDFGASGSRTLFLIYKLDEVRELYSGFSGIDGSAYFLGGAGITFLSNNKVIMAPIRTGIGIRLGANVGYLRFTPKPTWNPF
jgi:hypothetical protein